ncbi:MAG: ABC transporter substrate-binding protein [Alphaproteobacteria bacterium]|nr:ABC transporter substrate-binding protein [Alphaproteobacteria bacterium]
MAQTRISRRKALKGLGTAVAAASASFGFPAILKAQDVVKIGFLTALTGLETILGETQLHCFELAVDDVNAAGGAGGRKLEYIVEDDQTTTQGAIDKARKLMGKDNVDSIIGMIASLERVAALSVTSPAKKLLIYTTYYEGGECDKYLVCTGQVPNQQIDPMIPWVTQNMGKTVYVMGSDYIWPRGSTDTLKVALEANGASLVGADFFPFGTQDFGPAFQKVKSANPDILWLMFAGSDSIVSVKQYRSFDMKPQLIYHGWDETILEALPAEEQEGIIASQAYFQQLDNPVNNGFKERFAAKFGSASPINAIGEATYDAVWLYAKAIELADSVDPEKVIPAMSQVEFDAPQGHVNLLASNNHMRCNSIMARVTKDRTFEIVENYGQIDPHVPDCSLA